MKESSISVIIPTLNEATHLPVLLRSLIRQRWVIEIIVVDGGSTDGTRQVATKFHVKWVNAAPGKGRQYNAGARIAAGEILLFLHADSELPAHALDNIPHLLNDRFVAGSFGMQFDDPSIILKAYAWFTKINLGLFIYGDQGLFIPSKLFKEMSGYAEIPLMEDVEIVDRLKKLGRLVKSPVIIRTSARRFRENGLVKQQLLNLWIILQYRVGISIDKIQKYYPYK